jgi:tRNA dimethylallyltransferase
VNKYNCIVVLGPTASGKTQLACQLACLLNGEIISADSRQVYKGLDIGTGKDLAEYTIKDKKITYHLIDIVDPSEQFYLHQFTEQLKTTFEQVLSENKLPVICGGTGLYLDALRKDFAFTQIKEDEALRKELESLSKEELTDRLEKYPKEFINHVDLHSKKRIIRGIEIAEHRLKNPAELKNDSLPYRPYYIGILPDLTNRRDLIRQRLLQRLNGGLVDEVKNLLKKGLTHTRLEQLGLEYKFISCYLQNKISEKELVIQLQTAIFQFAKRQMTWFRKMEKEGVEIRWIKTGKDREELIKDLEKILRQRI